MVKVLRNSNMFERLLLIVGIAVVIVGIYLIHKMRQLSDGALTPEFILVIILWLILIFVIINSAISENTREELGVIMHTNSAELKLLQDVATEQIQEVKLMRQVLSEHVAELRAAKKGKK